MTYQALAKLSAEALQQQASQSKTLLQKLRFAHAISPIENPMRLRAARKQLARIKTLQNAKQ